MKRSFSFFAVLLCLAILIQSIPVFAGEQIGCVGMTGNTSDPHLHFEMREYPFRWGSGGPDDYDGDHIDPFSFFGG